MVCLGGQFNFFSTTFDPRAWTLVVFWKESLGRQPHLSTLDNRGGNNTNNPSPPNVTFFDDPENPFGQQGPQPPAPPEPHSTASKTARVRLVYRKDGIQYRHQQVVEKELKLEIHRVSDYTRIRDLDRLSLNLFQHQ